MPVWWLVVASTKDAPGLFSGSGALWFSGFHLFDNLGDLFTYNNGEYLRWLGNSVLYAFAGGVGCTIVSVLAGYGFAKFDFRGRSVVFALVLGSVMVPLTALVIPTFVMMSNVGLTDTIWAVILPSLLSPFARLPDAGLRGRLGAGRAAGRGPHRRRRRAAHVPAGVAAADAARRRHRAAALGGRHLEQLLPAADHAVQLQALSR